jgi:hypothetical protein
MNAAGLAAVLAWRPAVLFAGQLTLDDRAGALGRRLLRGGVGLVMARRGARLFGIWHDVSNRHEAPAR